MAKSVEALSSALSAVPADRMGPEVRDAIDYLAGFASRLDEPERGKVLTALSGAIEWIKDHPPVRGPDRYQVIADGIAWEDSGRTEWPRAEADTLADHLTSQRYTDVEVIRA
jgi:hypothetical protein